jgi:hypothetical protein
LFSQSQAGARASANIYSLIESAKVNKINVNAKGIEDIEALLPWNVALN